MTDGESKRLAKPMGLTRKDGALFMVLAKCAIVHRGMTAKWCSSHSAKGVQQLGSKRWFRPNASALQSSDFVAVFQNYLLLGG